VKNSETHSGVVDGGGPDDGDAGDERWASVRRQAGKVLPHRWWSSARLRRAIAGVQEQRLVVVSCEGSARSSSGPSSLALIHDLRSIEILRTSQVTNSAKFAFTEFSEVWTLQQSVGNALARD
jgi:hypothetical protein